MRARRLTAALAVAGVAMAMAPAAWADDGGGAFVDEEGNPTATARDGGPGDGGARGSGRDDGCWWVVLIENDFEWALYDRDGNRRYSDTGRWLALNCPLGDPGAVGGILIVPEGVEVDVEALAAEALASVGISAPTINTSPAADRRLYVQVPTWFWLEGGWWQPYQATASTGRVQATVVATPVAVTWEPGDGGSLTCAGPGRAWQPGLPESAADCTHTYRSSSAGQPSGRFELTATVRLEIRWASNTGQGGTLPAITRSTSTSVEVGEIQAIGTR
jgi:hypothetical protein